jgi:hypothetical protein
MSIWSEGFLNNWLSKKTSIFSLRLWVVIGILVGAAIVLVLFLLSICFTSRRRTPRRQLSSSAGSGSGKTLKIHLRDRTPPVSKDIREIVHQNSSYQLPLPEVQIDIGKADHRVVHGGDRRTVAEPPPAQSGSTTGTVSGESRAAGDGTGTPAKAPEVSHLGWGHWSVLSTNSIFLFTFSS